MVRHNYWKLFLILAVIHWTWMSCGSDDDMAGTGMPNPPDPPETPAYDVDSSYRLTEVAYGDDQQHRMDIYLPEGRSSDHTKVFVLIHGGAWSEGDKSDMNDYFDQIIQLYPDYACVNMNYRLGTVNDPGFPKQIHDIESALEELQGFDYQLDDAYFLMGVSAGAHLSMLYGYGFDTSHMVQAICNIVGPADLTDINFTNNPVLQLLVSALTGSANYSEDPELYEKVSPVHYITSDDPPTISFYGDSDPLIPNTQKDLLHDALQGASIPNEVTIYAGGHADWNALSYLDLINKLKAFKEIHF